MFLASIFFFMLDVRAEEYVVTDLVSSSSMCRQVHTSGVMSSCGETSPLVHSSLLGTIVGATAIQRNIEINQFADDLRQMYVKRVFPMLANHYAAVRWLTGSGDRQLTIRDRTLKVAELKCAEQIDVSAEKSQLARKMREIDENGGSQFNTDQADSGTIQSVKNVYMKKFLVAALELNRLLKQSGTNAHDRSAREKIKRIVDAYPQLSLDADRLASFVRDIEQDYNAAATEAGYRSIEYSAEKIIFPKVFSDDETIDVATPLENRGDDILIPPACRRKPSLQAEAENRCDDKFDSTILRRIINSPIKAKIQERTANFMLANLQTQMNSINKFCDVGPCTLMALNPKETVQKINQIKDGFARRAAFAYACECDTLVPTVLMSEGTKERLNNAMIVGSVLCPFTYGLGCVATGIAGGILVSASAIEITSNLGAGKRIGDLANKFPSTSAFSVNASKADGRLSAEFSGGSPAVSAESSVVRAQELVERADAQMEGELIGQTVMLAGGSAVGFVMQKGGKVVLTRLGSIREQRKKVKSKATEH